MTQKHVELHNMATGLKYYYL